MRILQLTAHFSPNVGGVETHLNDLTQALVKRKYHVFVLTYQPLVTKTKWRMHEKKDGVEILRIPWFPGFFYKLVKNPILEFLYLLPGLFFVAPFVILFWNPEVVHTHGLVAGFAGVFWGKIFGKRVITTTHSIYHFPKNGLYHIFSKLIFNSSDAVLTLSKQSKNEIVNLGVSERKVKIFTYWVDLVKFKRTSGVNLYHLRGEMVSHLGFKNKSKQFVVLYVGRLIKKKGVLKLIEAAKIWHKNIMLVIIGTGPLEEKIRDQQLKINNLLFLGRIDNDKLSPFYSATDVTIVPSIHEEGFGRIILESLACGTPVIGSNRGAIPEAMDESVGKLIDITPENIKKTVEYFYKNPDKLGKLSKNARKFADKRYSEKNIKKILDAYKN
ncbi:hypothetical protein A3D01_04970 [Candidatus Woesebacteria bacterium RIFCSPHIGHO2_02_FULL_39_13]|uniref:Glycosyltransferase subfamily 4-like N-terminal domain-containing protein n=1 Tax=Candidatus Woesebacteria bacterium RIFCSPHIGHO2_02_FULL_39_13 TaxID=1802505 RepID=A0A1F7Z1B6_9BACT|nr:MAG: hypothetical protein A2692_00290 [Candidatus Woesebacteria bacterium RIFCSPHIGHO2_01_FULL_39_95]OGM32899.1 MAG: hypothetical protein A3D01_04970 [Candidatus Woesebacteria bacterium RIFCSPHIGHO2_02_FULL_39_13]OGM74412.1 MAG: hypothetical protein A3H19_05280 [Candidatus Woesebacteria bacterium RIFCSPLOWO2_12_FULL_39_9]